MKKLTLNYHNLLGVVILLWLLSITTIVQASPIINRIRRTGVFRAGTSLDASPFAFANNQGKLVGYSVDMLELIRERLEKKLNRKITLQLVALPPDQRIPSLLRNKVDIVCDASSFTWERDSLVDFSLSYGVTGTQILTKKGNKLNTIESLIDKKIGVLRQTTNESTIKRIQPQAKLVYFSDRNSAYQALKNNQIDGFASDSILIEAWIANQPNASDFEVEPSLPFSREGIGCMVPENNSQLLNTVNLSLYKFMQDFYNNDPKAVRIFDRWFGSQGVLPLNRDLRDLTIETMRLNIESREEVR
jgi:polar amino acid transport system substrate-binding protein